MVRVFLSSYYIKISKHRRNSSTILKWCLDFPKQEQYFTFEELTSPGLLLQGWLLTRKPQPITLEFVQQQEVRTAVLELLRPDVISAMLKVDAEDHPQLRCGFKAMLPLQQGTFSCYAVAGKVREKLFDAEVCNNQKVLLGKNNWLFLDNDTNKSVEQHQGRLLLTPETLQLWQQYFESLQTLSDATATPYAMLIAPTKEAVYNEFYPYPRAAITPIEQLLSKTAESFPVVYPRLLLQTDDPYSFLRTDTHWSTHGAKLGVQAALTTLGICATQLNTFFEKDTYRRVFKVGDLGVKCFPPKGADEWAPASFSLHAALLFDNCLPNFGRVMLFEKPDALLKARCLIFGSSSSYSMLNYLYRVFKEVIFVHSAGNVDASWVEKLQPDYLICQTNERFVIKAPQVGYSVRHVIAEKLEQLDAVQRVELVKKQHVFLSKKRALWVDDVIGCCQ